MQVGRRSFPFERVPFQVTLVHLQGLISKAMVTYGDPYFQEAPEKVVVSCRETFPGLLL